jgi:HSP20 family molecular chaperone IbpA
MLKYYMTRLPQGFPPMPIVVPRHNAVRFRRLHTWAEIAPIAMPKIGLSHTADTVVLTAALPGLTADDLAIEVSRDMVLLQGRGGFQRIVQLPIGVDHSRAMAEFADGVLTLTLPKWVMARSTRVPVELPVTIGSNSPTADPATPDPAMDLPPEMPVAAPPETADPTPGDPWQ